MRGNAERELFESLSPFAVGYKSHQTRESLDRFSLGNHTANRSRLIPVTLLPAFLWLIFVVLQLGPPQNGDVISFSYALGKEAAYCSTGEAGTMSCDRRGGGIIPPHSG